MKNNQNLNVWTNFALNHVYKDITEEALKAIDALMFLSPPDEETFKEVFLINIDIGVESLDVNRGPTRIQKEVNYNFSDFLLLKLIENFRRIYAIEKEATREKSTYYKKRGLVLEYDLDLLNEDINPEKMGTLGDSRKSTLENLVKQQSFIYTIIDKLKNLIHFKTEITFYPKAVIGKNYETTVFEMSCYLGLHQSLRDENVHIHENLVKIISPLFSLDEIQEKNLKLFKNLHYPYKRKFFIEEFLSKFSSLTLFENYFSFSINSNKGYFYKVILIDVLAKKDDLKLNVKQKIDLLTDLFRSSFFKYFSNDDKLIFEKYLNTFFEGIDYSILFKRHIVSPSQAHTAEYKFIIEKMKNSDDEELFIKSFYTNLSPEEKQKLIKLFDFTNQDFFKRVIDLIYKKSDNVKKLEQILPYFLKNITKESLAYIVAKNIDFFPTIQPYYLAEKFSSVLSDKMEEITVSKKI